MKNLDQILKKTPIIKLENGSLINITFKEIINVLDNAEDNKLSNPDIQSDLDDDKVDEIYKCYNANKSFFVSKCLITIAYISDDSENTYFIVDGQHRLAAIKKIIDDDDENGNMLISFQKVDSHEQMNNLFSELNKDSEHNSTMIKKSMSEIIKLCELKKKFSQIWKNCYAVKKSQNKYFYALNEFIKNTNDYFNDRLKDEKLDDIIKDINYEQKKFFKKIGYLETADDDMYYADERKMIKEQKNMMFCKNNNFIAYLCHNHEPFHEGKKNRYKFSENERKKIWKKHYKSDNCGKCPIFNCNTELYFDVPNGYHLGHIISLNNGGEDDETNVRPICGSCNLKMGTENWDDYNEKVKRKELWKKFGKDEECSMDNCNKDISEDNFQYISFTNKKKKTYKLVCKKCYDKHNESSSESDSSEDEKPKGKIIIKKKHDSNKKKHDFYSDDSSESDVYIKKVVSRRK